MNPSKRNKLAKQTARATAALGLTAATSIASAMPLTELFFEQIAGFGIVDSTGEFPVSDVGEFAAANPNSAGDSVAGTTTFGEVFWRGPNGAGPFSGLLLESFNSSTTPGRFDSTGLVADDNAEWNEGDIWVIDQFTHINEEIQDFGTLWVGDTIADLTIFSDAVGGNALTSDTDSRTTFTFTESRNGSSCDRPSPFFDGNGPLDADAPDAPGCDDYFDGVLNVTPLSAEFNGFIYDISFTLIPGQTFIGSPGLDPVGDVLVCGAGLGCDPQYDPPGASQRVYTPEYGADALTFGASQLSVGAFWTVRQVPVPAPAPLLLISAGVLGLALRGSKKRVSSTV